jgi:hypothetical protein
MKQLRRVARRATCAAWRSLRLAAQVRLDACMPRIPVIHFGARFGFGVNQGSLEAAF